MKYCKRPVVIEAMQWTGDNRQEILDFIGVEGGFWHDGIMVIYTLEGTLNASYGDWIIKGVKGEFYPFKPDIFDATYEAVS